MKPSSTWAVAAALLALLGGCAVPAEQKDDLLVDAGFTRVRADSPGWSSLMTSLPPHRFAHRTVNGVPMVFYADPVACRCVYSATPQVYASYKQLHAAEAQNFDEAASMPSALAQ